MTLAEQMIDSEIRMTVHVDPILFAHIRRAEKCAVIIQMIVRHYFGDVLIIDRGVAIGELADRNVADIVRGVGFVSVDRLWRHRVLG